MGLLVEAGDGYPAQPNMDAPKQNTREGTAALPYAENSIFGTDKLNDIPMNRFRVVSSHNSKSGCSEGNDLRGTENQFQVTNGHPALANQSIGVSSTAGCLV